MIEKPASFRTIHHAVTYHRQHHGLTAGEVHAMIDRGEIVIGKPAGDQPFSWDANGRAVLVDRMAQAPIGRVAQPRLPKKEAP